MIAAELLALLACPSCKGPVTQTNDAASLVCPSCRLRYPVREGIPVMLLDEAETLQGDGDQSL